MKYFKNPDTSYTGLLVVGENRVISVVITETEKNINIVETNYGDINSHTIDQSWIEIQEEEADLMMAETRSILDQI